MPCRSRTTVGIAGPPENAHRGESKPTSVITGWVGGTGRPRWAASGPGTASTAVMVRCAARRAAGQWEGRSRAMQRLDVRERGARGTAVPRGVGSRRVRARARRGEHFVTSAGFV
jgi:hypothetical protein